MPPRPERAPTAGELSALRWDRPGTGRLLRSARAVTANSRFARRDNAKWVPAARRARVVYFGAPAVRPAPAPKGLPRRFVLCASRRAEYKGLDVLVFAWTALADIPLVLCGQDHSRGGLGRFARRLGVERSIVDLGRVPHSRMQALLARAEALVLPSRRDTLGGVVLEALAAGTPVVASRVGGVPELMRHGREGLFVPPKEPAALARALRRLWNDPVLRRRLAAGALKRSRRFTWLAACAAYARLAGLKPGARVAVVVWENGRDQTAAALRRNAVAGLRALGYRASGAAWAGRRPSRAPLEALSRTRPDAWVVFLLRYREVAVLARFFEDRDLRPLVNLC
ncbi:MAG: glycosyltransferase family 4 protein [Elusimicrobia bacterium]|nr:glycosyltransferase family 4 protein [Elusimicrobiota bacterium]